MLVAIGAGIIIPSYLSVLQYDEYKGNAALTAGIVIASIELVAVLIGSILVHVGVHNRRPLFLIPLLVGVFLDDIINLLFQLGLF